jgi:DNA-binding transcriptional LysR family regulator
MIELRHLRYFIAVAEELNFRRAADRIHIDQTPLSRTVRDLENQWGVQLFVRGPRKLHLTPAGTRLLQEARKVLIRLERTRRAVCDTDARVRAPLRIGVADGLAQAKLSQCFVRWGSVASEIPLELTELRATEMKAALLREELDAGFSFGLADDRSIVQQPAWSYPLMALLPRAHELASMPILTIAEVLAFPVLSCHADRLPGLRQQIQAIVQRHTTRPTFAGETSTVSGHITRIAAGLGVGLGDAGHFAIQCGSDVIAVPLVEDERITTFVLHKHQRFGLTDVLQRFVANAQTLD